jgi:excinuclease ABC subunit C
VAEWLTEARGRKVSLAVPQRRPRVELLQMARENAAHSFREKQRSSDDIESRLEELQERLRLPVLPRRIECCDISHLGGGDTVGSIVSLLDGQPDKKHYRSFHVKTTSQGDDYAAMYEVLARRFRRGRAAKPRPAEAAEASGGGEQADAAEPVATVSEEILVPDLDDEAEDRTGEPESAEAPIEMAKDVADKPAPQPAPEDSDWELPDLLVVDGGRGQLQVALSAARDLGLHDLSIVGLAKERETPTGEKLVDRVYLPGQKNGIPLRQASSALFFLARARDEAHRFANHVRKRLGKARRLRSEIEDIPGLNDAIRKALLRGLGSMAAIRTATDEQILAVKGVQKRHLTALRKVIPPPGG